MSPHFCTIVVGYVSERIKFYLCILEYRCINGMGPSFFPESIVEWLMSKVAATSVHGIQQHALSHRPLNNQSWTTAHFQWPLREPGTVCQQLSLLTSAEYILVEIVL